MTSAAKGTHGSTPVYPGSWKGAVGVIAAAAGALGAANVGVLTFPGPV